MKGFGRTVTETAKVFLSAKKASTIVGSGSRAYPTALAPINMSTHPHSTKEHGTMGSKTDEERKSIPMDPNMLEIMSRGRKAATAN